ncbi:MAG: hypothetical protein MRY64_16030 [Hyphomonadaceae bacterium]|nr:hypothetical protein [Hyphomonadaceae bacterium]
MPGLRDIGFPALLILLALLGAWTFLDIIRAEPRETWGEVDPEIARAVEIIRSWDGRCDLEDPETRAKIEAGASVYHAGAIACLVPDDLFDGGWERRSNAEKAALLELLAAHYVLSGDERLLGLDICQIEPGPRDRAYFGLSRKMGKISIQPMRYALEQPDPLDELEARERFFACAEWTLEDRLSAGD